VLTVSMTFSCIKTMGEVCSDARKNGDEIAARDVKKA